MARHRSTHPTNAELEILRVLWRRGPSNVADVISELEREEKAGYTTVLKLLQIMVEKGLADRDEEIRPHQYRAAVDQVATQKELVKDLMDRAFGGSSADLVLRALSAKPASAGELVEIRRLLDHGKGGRK
jgi:predicted transcriptional regulator